MKPFKDVQEAVQYIEKFEGRASELKLEICESLLDPAGINMSIITDKVLEKGWEPNGFEEREGYRVYLYKELE